jgi:hypothetical protein
VLEGDTLWTSFANTSRAGREADALLHEIEKALPTMSNVQDVREVDSSFIEIESDRDHGYSNGYYWTAWHLRRRGTSGHLKHCGTLTIALSF